LSQELPTRSPTLLLTTLSALPQEEASAPINPNLQWEPRQSSFQQQLQLPERNPQMNASAERQAADLLERV